MTTRGAIWKRAAVGYLLLMLPIFVGVMLTQTTRPPVETVYAISGAIAVPAVTLTFWYMWRTPCLNCRKPLHGLAIVLFGRPTFYVKAYNRCPNCGVPIDQNIPRA
jgi:hypothetical protein